MDKGTLTPGKEVHHIIHLDEININIPEVALGSDNLILLCKECHHKRHKNNKITSDDLIFNENGELIMKQAPPILIL